MVKGEEEEKEEEMIEEEEIFLKSIDRFTRIAFLQSWNYPSALGWSRETRSWF